MRGPEPPYSCAIGAMNAKARIETFLRGRGVALGVVGEPGSGKMHAAQLAAKAAGFHLTILDRTQGPIHYNRLGALTLGDHGLAKTVFVICGADAETSWPDPKSLPEGAKLIFIGNSCRAEMKRASLQVEQVSRPSPEAMTKSLFLDQGWDVIVAQRLARLSGGDWRQLRALEMLFKNVDVASLGDDEFQRLLLDTKADKNPLLDVPPSAVVHQLFSGHAARSNTLEHYADHGVLMWAEANKDLVCNSIEDMATLQEAAVFSDVLMNGGENQLGLETFARTAANAANSNIRYDFARYRNPWAARRETPATAAIRKAWERHAPWTKRQRGRLALLQQRGDVPLATQARKRAAPKANTKKAAKRTAGAPKRAAAPPLLVQK